MLGRTPIPESETVWGDPAALSAIEIYDAREPVAVGVNVTEIVQLACEARVVAQVLDCVKSAALVPVHTDNSVRINQHTCGTLIADLVDALSLLASTSQSKDWKSLPRPVVECIKCWEFVSRKNPVLISKNFVRLDQGEAAFPLRKANVEATGLLRLSGASLISVV